jgi:hypothetical protein
VEPVIGEPGDHAIGRSRGGLTTKVHALSDGAGRLLVVLLTAGNVHDTTMFGQLLAAVRVARAGPGRPRTRPDYLVADKGYSSWANRGLLRARGIGHTIPEKADQAAHRRRRGSTGGRPPGLTATATPAVTASNAASASSNTGEGWPPATTSTPATTPAPSTSRHY